MSTASEMKYISWKNVEREHLNPQIDREMVVGHKIMLARVLMKKGAHVPLHHRFKRVNSIQQFSIIRSQGYRSWAICS